ncbi:MAG: hypothetical protein FWD94_03260 [Treponema sp.]|nr:hypothetical protein [Treponema sp.]
MKVIGIENVRRKDVPIYYRLVYTGLAKIEFVDGTMDCPVDFSVEIKPTGAKEITVTLTEGIPYPSVPVIRELKKVIEAMHSDGSLPNV